MRSLTALFALSIATSALVGCKQEPPKPTEAPAVMTVSTQLAAVRDLPQKLALTGSVAAWESMAVNPAANGLRVVEVLAEENAMVRKGQVLARLDDATLRAQVAAAQARAASAAAQLQKMRNPSRRQDLRSAEAAVRQAEATAEQARDAYQRFQALAAEGGVSQAELVARQTAFDSARAAAEQARQRLSLAREGSRAEDLRMAEAQAAEARATLAQMQALLAQTRVTAPGAGKIIKRDVNLGDISAVGKPMFQMVRDDRLEVEVLVPETDLGRVTPGMSASISSDARPDLTATGTVRQVSPAVETASRQGTVEIDLPKGAGFQVGMFVRASVKLGTLPTLAVPAAAIVAKESGSEVFVLEGDKAKARQVVPGPRADGWVAIASGLKAGDQVITMGVGFLKDGDKVDVAPALSPMDPKAPALPLEGQGALPAGGPALAAKPGTGR